MLRNFTLRMLSSAIMAVGAASCAATQKNIDQKTDRDLKSIGAEPAEWTAYGFLSPDPTREPELIGLYRDKANCEAALNAWLSRQVVGNPVSGDCLPIDRH